MACLLIVGAGTAFQHSPSSALVTTAYAEGGRRGALGLYNSSGDVGKLAFSGLFSLAIGAGFAWQEISILLGLLTLLAAAGIASRRSTSQGQTDAQRQALIGRRR